MTWTFRRPHQYRPQNRLGHDFRVLLYAAGAMSGVATLSFGDSATLGGTGELAASESMTLSASAIPGNTNPNELVGTAGLTFGENAVLTGSGALVATEPLVIGGSATLGGTNAYQPHMRPKRRPYDVPRFDYHQWDGRRWTIFPYSVNTATSGIGSIALSANGLLRATGALVTSTPLALSASGALLGEGALVGTATITFGQDADLTSGGSGFITAQQGFEFSASGTLTGVGALYGPAELTFDAVAISQALDPPSGEAVMSLQASGTLRNAAEGATIVTAMSFSSTDGLQMFFSA